jgi:hypothetical protein
MIIKKPIIKKTALGLLGLILLLSSCDPDTNTNPNTNHFRMTVNGTELSTLPENVIYFTTVADSCFGIYASGGTVIYNSIELDHIYQPGTYNIYNGNICSNPGGLRYQTADSIYYINSTHGYGTITLETFHISPGVINEIKGTYQGTAATDNGHTVTITNGDYYYKQP